MRLRWSLLQFLKKAEDKLPATTGRAPIEEKNLFNLYAAFNSSCDFKV